MAILLLATFRAHAAENPPLPENASAVHLDEVGRPVLPESDTPPARKPPARAAVAPTPAAPLAVQPAPGGGQMIILDDRFRNDSTARRDADGRRTVHCTLGTGAQRTDE